MQIWLTNLASDVSGYKLAIVGGPNPGSAALATSVTATTGSGDNIAATDTSGGTALKWITKPFLADVAVPAESVLMNIWAKESNASANAGLGLRLAEYTTSEQSAFLDFNGSVELTTTMARYRALSSNPTATTIDAGNRLVIGLDVVAVGTMGGSQTVTIDYDGPTRDADGDSFILIPVSGRVSERQVMSGSAPTMLCFSRGFHQGVIDNLNALIGTAKISAGATVQSVLDDLAYERDLL